MSPRLNRLLCLLGCALPTLATVVHETRAFAQGDPKFAFANAEPAKTVDKPVDKPVEWKAQLKGGYVITTGNSQTNGGTFTANASRKEGNNKLTLETNGAYGHSNNRIAIIDNVTNPAAPTYTIGRRPVISTNNYAAKGRYDRFLTANNTVYASGQAAADKVAGKTFFGGGQVGYSRQLLSTDMHLLVAELGYDFSYERYQQQAGKTLDPVTIHSARLFVGETLKLGAATGINASVEALFNLNKEAGAVDVSNNQLGVGAFKDTRVLGEIGLTTTLVKQLAIGFGLTVKYDQNPAPLPPPPDVGTATAAAPYFFADKVDTLSEVTLTYTFL